MPRTYWELVEPVWDTLVEWDEVAKFKRNFATTSEPARTLFAAHWLYSEVDNGGFQQFYWNSTGILAPEAAEAFDALDMPLSANVVRQTMRWFGGSYPRERETRCAALVNHEKAYPNREDPFDVLDEKFYDVVETENGGFVAAANEFAKRIK